MNSADALKLIQVLLGLTELARSIGVDVSKVVEAQQQARAEGRDLTDAELAEFRNDAQASIDAARQA